MCGKCDKLSNNYCMTGKENHTASKYYIEKKYISALLLSLLCIGGALPLLLFVLLCFLVPLCWLLAPALAFIRWSAAYKCNRRWKKREAKIAIIFQKNPYKNMVPLFNLCPVQPPPRRSKWKQMLGHCPSPITAMHVVRLTNAVAHTPRFFRRRQEDGGVRSWWGAAHRGGNE